MNKFILNKSILMASLAAFGWTLESAQAVNFIADFESPTYVRPNAPEHDPVATQDGWKINDIGLGGDDGSPAGYLSFLYEW